MASRVLFTLNGELQSVDVEEATVKTLNDYIRCNTQYTGTKLSCGQGGCGACTVVLARPSEKPRAVNSCLTPLANVHGAAVLTVEGLSAADGSPHPIAERLAKFNGSQCGFCTPGMVMQLYSTLSSKDGGKGCSEKDLEHSINGNLCRCTGYRPIVECAKSFAADTSVKNQLDPSVVVGPYDKSAADPNLVFPPADVPLEGSRWLRPSSLSELLEVMQTKGAVPVAGGTAAGVYPELGVADTISTVFADISAVKELSEAKVEDGCLRVGALVTWNRFVEILEDLISQGSVQNVEALQVLKERCGSIAGDQVRNRATLGGQVAIHRTKNFRGDWVPVLAALGATVEVCTPGSWGAGTASHDMMDFVTETQPFDGLIRSVLLPLPAANVVFRSWRVAKRSRNAVALVNAAFSAVVSAGKVEKATVILGAVEPKPVRLKHLERALMGVRSQEVQTNASTVLSSLCEKVKADLFPLTCDHGKEQTEHIVSGFVIKFLVAMFGDAVPKDWQSSEYALHDMQRSSAAAQSFPTPVDLGGPLNKPITKTTAIDQTTGRAKYTDDVAKPRGTLIASYILCPEANVVVKDIDTAPAKKLLGEDFHSVIRAEDLRVNALDPNAILGMKFEPAYKSDTTHHMLLPQAVPSQYAGQPVALLLAHGDKLSVVERAAAACSSSLQLDDRTDRALIGGLQGSLAEEITETMSCHKGKEPADPVIDKARAAGAGHYITGQFSKKSQSHFYIEGQSVIAIPDEGGITCYVAAQGTDLIQKTICHALGLKQSQVTVKYRRVGGGFGGKLTFPALFSAVASQAALHTGHPVRLVLPRETDMSIVGGRPEMDGTWHVAVEPSTGKIQALSYDLCIAHGAGEDMVLIVGHAIAAAIDEVYGIPSMAVKMRFIKQHLPQRTAVRAPGHLEATMLMEAVIDGIAGQLGIPGHLVREKNFFQGKFNTSGLQGAMIPSGHLGDYSNLALWSSLKSKVGYEQRLKAVQEFNKANAWKKRGISATPARYGVALTPGNFARVDIFKDGSVQIAVTASEIGQGLHTKVGQMVCTHLTRELGAGPPLSCVRFLETSTDQLPNGNITGGSTTSEGAMFAACDAARQLADRLRPCVKQARKLAEDEKSEEGLWFDITAAAFSTKFLGVLAIPQNLTAIGAHYPPVNEVMYETYGVAAAEVELDVLTGEWRVLFAHLLFDVGQSYNPMVDIGQMEGAFMMGLGHLTTEAIDFDPTTGKLLTNNTWSYKPPIACDVPETFKVELVDMRSDRLNNPVMSAIMSIVGSITGCCAIPWKPTKISQAYKSAKAIGEPPALLATAVKSALSAALVDATGGPLPEHLVPIPARPFAVLPLLEAQRPGSGAVRDDDSTATGTSAASTRQ
uniref:Abscisic-aldehyde oxidase n=1 Tax=Scrippsiella trochoidea TaxID=71861 RepID=A0A1L2D736_SCRTR|nr:abscisic-aldehyde oxidase [Scrippsiella trochoidea]